MENNPYLQNYFSGLQMTDPYQSYRSPFGGFVGGLDPSKLPQTPPQAPPAEQSGFGALQGNQAALMGGLALLGGDSEKYGAIASPLFALMKDDKTRDNLKQWGGGLLGGLFK